MTDEARLNRLAQATEGLSPPADFADRVMLAVEQLPVRREPWVARGIALSLFAAAAAVSIYVSSSAQTTLDTTALSNFDVVELEQ
ncbi:MAG: hypothetical protein KC776_43050 [Myxococcales bacterium]|nr:hypothetical protein [Myxococcales bacterium]MCB9582368.1 hypothetical protein [Polyangiaceae bacterium]